MFKTNRTIVATALTLLLAPAAWAGPACCGGGPETFRWVDLKPAETPAEMIELANKADPVTGETIEAEEGVTLDFRGLRIRFKDEASRWQFEGQPLRYLADLSLEPMADGTVRRVGETEPVLVESDHQFEPPQDGSEPPAPFKVLHRGVAILFATDACANTFMQDPAAQYESLGLVEQGGTLVLAADAEEEAVARG
jgi:YHS domain-containing protein